MTDQQLDLPDFPEDDDGLPAGFVPVDDVPRGTSAPAAPAPGAPTGRRKAKKAPAKKAPARASVPRGTSDTTPKVGRPSKDEKLRKQLGQQVELLAIPVAALALVFGEPELYARDAEIIVENAEDIGNALGAVAESNPKVRKALERSVESSSWLGVALALLPVGQAIYINHATRPQEGAPSEPVRNPFPAV